MNFAMLALFGLCQLTFASPPGSAMASKTAPKTVALDPPGIDVPSEQIDDPPTPSAMGPPPPVLEGSMTATDGPIPPPSVDTYTTTLSPMTPIVTNFGDSSQYGQNGPSILDGSSSLPSYQPKPVSSYGPPPTGSGSDAYGNSGMGGGFQSSNFGYGQHNSYSSHSSSYSSGMGSNYGSQPFYGMGQQQPNYGGYQNFHGGYQGEMSSYGNQGGMGDGYSQPRRSGYSYGK